MIPMNILTLIIPLIFIAFAFGVILYLRHRDKQNTPSAIIKRFEDAQIAQCARGDVVFEMRYFAPGAVDLNVHKSLVNAWLRIKNLIVAKNWDISKLDRRSFSFYLVPEEIQSGENKTPSLVKAIDCSSSGAYGNGFCSPLNKILRVNEKFQYDERGKVAHPDVQIITIAGRGLHETFGTNDQRLVVVVPKDLSKPENVKLIEDGAFNELEHLANFHFQKETFEANCTPDHEHPIF